MVLEAEGYRVGNGCLLRIKEGRYDVVTELRPCITITWRSMRSQIFSRHGTR